MQLPKYLIRRRALPSGGLWFEVAILVAAAVSGIVHLDPPASLVWPVVYACFPLVWLAGIHYLRSDLRRCRRGSGIYNWRMTLSRILAIVNGFVVVRGLAVILLLLTRGHGM